MGYVEQYFGKGPLEITYADITNYFIDEREESDKIEFKSYVTGGDERDKENGVIRTICGMLNSEGGLIIWGSPGGQILAGKTEKVFKGNLSPVNHRIEKDYFINRITDGLTPSPKGVLFVRLEDNGNFVYLIDVEVSEYSPHQFRNVYYMRIDAQTRPAPHSFIEALFKKIKFPTLKGFIKLEKFQNDGRNFFLDIAVIIFNMTRLQNEHDVTYRVVLSHGAIFEQSQYKLLESPYGMAGHELRTKNPISTIFYNQPSRVFEQIQISPVELAKYNNEFTIWLYFGGESSPLLLSYYKIKIDLRNLNPPDLNSLFAEKDENRYSFEHSDDLGKSEEERINEILGR